MRRPSVHKVLPGTQRTWDADLNPGPRRALYMTACFIYGGAELMALAGIDNGAGRWCGTCWPGAHKGYRPRPAPESKWTNA